MTEIADRDALGAMVAKLGACLDEHRFADLADLFAEDASVETPGGTAHGRDALLSQASRTHAEFAVLQHLLSNVLVDIADDSASVRANLIGIFVRQGVSPEFALGAVYRLRARRSETGWKFTWLQVAPVWRTPSR